MRKCSLLFVGTVACLFLLSACAMRTNAVALHMSWLSPAPTNTLGAIVIENRGTKIDLEIFCDDKPWMVMVQSPSGQISLPAVVGQRELLVLTNCQGKDALQVRVVREHWNGGCLITEIPVKTNQYPIPGPHASPRIIVVDH